MITRLKPTLCDGYLILELLDVHFDQLIIIDYWLHPVALLYATFIKGILLEKNAIDKTPLTFYC